MVPAGPDKGRARERVSWTPSWRKVGGGGERKKAPVGANRDVTVEIHTPDKNQLTVRCAVVDSFAWTASRSVAEAHAGRRSARAWESFTARLRQRNQRADRVARPSKARALATAQRIIDRTPRLGRGPGHGSGSASIPDAAVGSRAPASRRRAAVLVPASGSRAPYLAPHARIEATP